MHVTKILNFIFLTHYNKIGISWMKSIYVNERQESVLISTKIVTWMKSIYVNERQGENQMAVFGNVQKLPFAFFPLSSHIISQHDLYLVLPFFGCRLIGLLPLHLLDADSEPAGAGQMHLQRGLGIDFLSGD